VLQNGLQCAEEEKESKLPSASIGPRHFFPLENPKGVML
jgi:hypothetical protein